MLSYILSHFALIAPRSVQLGEKFTFLVKSTYYAYENMNLKVKLTTAENGTKGEELDMVVPLSLESKEYSFDVRRVRLLRYLYPH